MFFTRLRRLVKRLVRCRELHGIHPPPIVNTDSTDSTSSTTNRPDANALKGTCISLNSVRIYSVLLRCLCTSIQLSHIFASNTNLPAPSHVTQVFWPYMRSIHASCGWSDAAEPRAIVVVAGQIDNLPPLQLRCLAVGGE